MSTRKAFLPEAEYRAKIAAGELHPLRADAHVIRGDELLAQVQAESGPECLMSFSGGKDSLAAYLAIRPRFARVVPFHMYAVPGLEFVEEGLRYFERHLLDEPIIRMPHPQLYRMLGELVFQPPERMAILDAARLHECGYDTKMVRSLVIEETGVGKRSYVATGVRASDSPTRRLSILTHGPISRQAKTFMPIWDWRKAQAMKVINDAGLRLPVDYDLFGRSFDGLSYQYLAPIKRHFPRDYERILQWFPLADMELFRMEKFGRMLP
jgi:hypothetical protein